ncbi:MAG: O-antigen ligase family protein [Bacteroidota bacterium]
MSLFFKAILWLGLLAAILALIGMLLVQIQIFSPLVRVYDNYPYLGDSIRAQALTPSPTTLANILSIGIIFLISKIWIQGDRKLFYWIALILMLLACFLTLSKGVLLLAAGILFIFSRTPKLSSFLKKSFQIGMFLFAAAYLFGTHFLVVDKNHPQLAEIKAAPFNTGEVIASTKTKLFIPTAYTALKEASLTIGNRNLLAGVGAGNHNLLVGQLKTEGLFPEQIPNFDPHSTYFGGFAELGLLGVASIALIVVFISRMSFKLLKKYPSDYFTIALVSCLLVMSLEAIATDILNFRHFWILLAALGFLKYQGDHNGLPAGIN